MQGDDALIQMFPVTLSESSVQPTLSVAISTHRGPMIGNRAENYRSSQGCYPYLHPRD
jgi:hypothetical protein